MGDASATAVLCQPWNKKERSFLSCYAPPVIDSAAPQASPRDRLLRVAGELFYREGVNAVGVDRILEEAGVTRATMYRHFTGKEALVVAYLREEDAALRAGFAAAEAQASGDRLLQLALEGIADDAARHHTRGCPFINATAEYPDATSPVRRVVTEHRHWFRQTLERYLREAGREDVEEGAAELVMLRDAVLVGSYLDGAAAARTAFLRAATRTAALG
jgi:AcrR family transcriptional regulator